MMSNRAAMLLKVNELVVAEISMPVEPGPGQVTVRIEVVGICGSDVHCPVALGMPPSAAF